MTAIVKPPTQPWMSILHGRVCVGHLLNCGPAGWELFDADDKSLGIFPTQHDAVNALDREQP